ncbi:MAG: GntR family transcriptional regulator [Rhodocyclales bacterium]|nr:GntR family transcriptional regulator [Rhodocyclales bacterium]
MVSDNSSIVAALRKRIIDGHYAPGERLAEIPVAEALGVSRTPVRLAFRTLQQEGLLQRVGKRALAVRVFSPADVQCAIEVRGVLEGLAARLLAERGLDPKTRAALLDCLRAGETIVGMAQLSEESIGAWSEVNARFHATIVDADERRVIADAIARNNHLPFASADSIIIERGELDKAHQRLRIAQLHHRLVFDALESGESARVEMLMREHAQIGLRYDSLFKPIE